MLFRSRDVPDPRPQHDNPCGPTPTQTFTSTYDHSERIEGGRALWQETLMTAYDVVTHGYTTKNTNNLRLIGEQAKS